jgi:hypothetical protein
MSLEIRVDLPQLEQLFTREQSGGGPGGIQDRRGMPLGQYEAIVVGIPRILRIEAHLAEEHRGHDVSGGQARRRMPGAGFARGQHRIDAQLGRQVPHAGHGCSHGLVHRFTSSQVHGSTP